MLNRGWMRGVRPGVRVAEEGLGVSDCPFRSLVTGSAGDAMLESQQLGASAFAIARSGLEAIAFGTGKRQEEENLQ